ncbi:MAG TPA: hypothetical protein PK047_10430 [Saprospiraceae bacterium]|nr:hypothetical protein [Saprospiraceae bacterium]HRO09272.1 hypothetical protein [Saprospiraceae bacterium]HRP42304.1 hypothetical protein [Saprospiraceae bacterium]
MSNFKWLVGGSVCSGISKSKYKAKMIHESMIPSQIIDVNHRLKTNVLTSKILKQNQ